MMIVYEDDYILIANKPNDVLIHHSYMARNMASEATLLSLLKSQFNHENIYPVHRLDRKTSGLVIFAKKKEYITPFQTLFEANKIKKEYYALVRGHLNDTGMIDTPVKGRDAKVYKDALTNYHTINRFTINVAVGPYEESRYSVVLLTPETGRLHQLRIHMNKISHPIICDPKYGDRFHNKMFNTQYNIQSLFLHAASLTFLHPILNTELTVKAKFPTHWQLLSEKFNVSLDI